MATAVLEKSPEALVKAALGKVTALGTLPEITAKIISTVEDPKSSAAQLHKIVSHDPALVTRILKVVNSAFYGLPGQIASIERAIVLLGLNAVKNIAVAASLGQLFRGVRLCEGFNAKDLWTHCIAVAVAARDIAKNQKMPIADEAFLGGMIHDIGLLLELQVWPDQVRSTCEHVRTIGGDFVAVERDQLGGVDHQMLGMALAEKWQFPRTCQLVAGYHHDPKASGDANRAVLNLVHAADLLCCNAGIGFNLTAKHATLDPMLIGTLGLDPAAVEKTRANLPTLLQNASQLLS
jgi:HD-like signal output (HDOD) protein